ncbi:MAG: DNA polymerase III subunit delta [Clostridia bacterium]|nr:DNA polymerase III subunit delta [Clostridia bacterium]
MAYTEKEDIVKLTKQIVASPSAGLYFLYGGEEFLKRRFLSDLKKAVIPDDVADLNCSVVTGPDQADRVLELAYTLPQFCEYRMIVWYNSGYPACQARFKKKTEETIGRVSSFPYLFLIIYSSEDEFSGSGKDERAALSKINGTALFFDRLTPARVQKWVIRHFEAEDVKISDDCAAYLIGRCGTGMTELSGAVSKLCAYVKEKGKNEVGRSDVEELVPAKPSFSAFFISDNIRKRDPSALASYIADAKSRAEKPLLVLSSITSEAEKLSRIKLAQKSGIPYPQAAKQLGLNEYVVKLAYSSVSEIPEKRIFRFLHACYEADKAMKNSSSDPWGLLMQLVCSV